MKKTFKQYNIEQQSWDVYLESKGYKKIKKKKDCGCQHEDYSHHSSQRSFLDYLSEATSFEQSWKQQGDKIHQRAQETEDPGEHLESPDSLRDHFQNTLLTNLNPEHHAWVLTRYRKGGINRLEDIRSRAIPSINSFNELKEKGETGQVKLSHFPTLGHLEDYVEARSAGKKTSAERFSGADHHVEEENEHWKVIIPKNQQAACKFGSGTRWCTASSEDNYFGHYSKQGSLRIMIPKAPAYEGEKYQWHAATNQLMNERDESVNFSHVMHGNRPWEDRDPEARARSLPKISSAFAYAKEGIGGKDYPIDRSRDAALASRQIKTLAHLEAHPDVKNYVFKHKIDRHEHLLTDVHFDEMAHSGSRESYDFLEERNKLTPHRRGILLNNSGDLGVADIEHIVHTGDEKLPEHHITDYITKLTRRAQEGTLYGKGKPTENVAWAALPHLLTSNSLTDHHISQIMQNKWKLITGRHIPDILITKSGLEASYKNFGREKELERIKTIDKVIPEIMNKSNIKFRNQFYSEAAIKKPNIGALTDAISPETLHKDYHRMAPDLDDNKRDDIPSSMKGLLSLVAAKHRDHILDSALKAAESTPSEKNKDRLDKGHYDHPLLRSITDDFTNRVVHNLGTGNKLNPNISSASDIAYGLSKQNVSHIVDAAANAHSRLTQQYLSHSDGKELDKFGAYTFGDTHSNNMVRHLLEFSNTAKLTPEHGKKLMGMLSERAMMSGHDAKIDGNKSDFIDPSGHANTLIDARDFHRQSSEIFRRTGLGKDEKYIGKLLEHPSTLMQSLAGNAAASIGKKYMFRDSVLQQKYNDVSPELREKIINHKNPMVRLNYFNARVGSDASAKFGQGPHIGHPEGQHEILDLAHAAMSDKNPFIRNRFYYGAKQATINILDRKPRPGQEFNPKDHATPEVLEKAKNLSDKLNAHADNFNSEVNAANIRTPGYSQTDSNRATIEMENFINKQ